MTWERKSSTLRKIFSFSEYQISIAVGQLTQCSHSNPKDVIDPSKIPLILEVTQAVRKINGTSLEIGTIGNYTLCYTAVIKGQVGDVKTNHRIRPNSMSSLMP